MMLSEVCTPHHGKKKEPAVSDLAHLEPKMLSCQTANEANMFGPSKKETLNITLQEAV